MSNAPRTKERLSRRTLAGLAVFGLLGVAAIQACAAGGADSDFWDPGGQAPAGGGGNGGATAATTGSQSGPATTGTTTGSGPSTTATTGAGPSTTGTTATTGSGPSTTSSTTSSTSGSGPSTTSSTTSTSSSSGSTAPTWTTIYNGIFGPSGTSTCAGSSCHTNNRSGFACGSTATSCYNGFINSGYLTSSGSASSSALVDPSQTCMCGSGLSGNMPKGHSCLTAAQITEIKAWLATGAPDN